MTDATHQKLKILIADDNESDRLILSTIVKKQGHTVITASNGKLAVEIFEKEAPDLILMDALMPVMDGLQAARHIKMMARNRMIPIIFLTSLKDADSLVECLDAGGDDFLTKPYNRFILQAKISAFNRMRNLHQQVHEQHDHLVREQEVAKGIFDNIAHQGHLQSRNIRYLLSPMSIFNGDMLLAMSKPSGGLYILLGDFTGHGLPAAIGAMPVAEIFYGMTQKGFSMKDILQEINAKLKAILPVGVFCCASMLDICFRGSTLEVWNGGLPSGILFAPDNRKITLLESGHLPLGVLSANAFKANTQIYEMKEGDSVYLWSDGIHEAQSSAGEMYGEQRLLDVFKRSKRSHTLFDDIIADVEDFAALGQQDDDITMIEVTMDELIDGDVNDEDNVTRHGTAQGPMDWSFSYELRPDSLKNFNPLPVITHLLMEVPGLRQHSGKLYTILAELFSNSLEHGVLGLNSAMKSSPEGFAEYYQSRMQRLEELNDGYVRISIDHTPAREGGKLVITMEDSGPGFEYQNTIVESTEENTGYCGRGIPLIRSLCESFEYMGDGNQVKAVFDWAYHA